jgi:flagellar biosynthesis protein FliQ
MKRHALDLISLLGGLLFVGLGVAFLLDSLNIWSADITWVPPIVLIVLGLAGVLSTFARRAPAGEDSA